MKETEKIYQSLLEMYKNGIQSKEPKKIREFLNDNSVELLKEDARFYLEILQLRAASFSLFGELNEAGEEYRKGYASCSTSGKWVYGLNWALQFMAEFSFKRDKAKIHEAMNNGIKVLDQALIDLPFDKYRDFYFLCLSNVKAFMLLNSDRKEEALASYANCKFIPVPIPEYNDKESLQVLFAHFTKGIAVAIELKNYDLLMNLMKVISIDDQTLNAEGSLFRIFYETLVSAFDMRAEFITEFNAMFKIKDVLVKTTPHFARFLDLIGEQDLDKLDLFFQKSFS
ncbi:hypothetical protein BZG02_15505 [Labilibaculum filiforme]|uniref:Uncharacterized protein n=1 Tax=Labilibaculum filiforme TaxID=1940526 RepID=A0A2N3HU87_9BACT|nr:hypothetical protein [Labilibaculum filiforme]PKQ61591.1 hypothetical protein BZG02_15505 [Labilibaculum filiforme]